MGTMSSSTLTPSRRASRHQQVELGEVAEDRVDVAVVGDVVAVVVLRRGIEGAEPDAVDAELLEIRQSGADAGEIADAVPGAVQEAADVDLVDHCVAPPVVPVDVNPLTCLCVGLRLCMHVK